MGHQLKLGQFYGQVTGKAEVCDVALSELAHQKPCKHGLHSHEAPYFSLLLQGTYSETFSGKVLQYRPMTIAFHPPSTTHSDEVGSRGGLFFIIELKREWLRKLSAHSMGVEVLPNLTGGKATSMAARLYQRILIAGDVAVNNMHVYTAETDSKARGKWLNSLNKIRELKPSVVIPGHSKVGAPLDASTAVDFTENYLLVFEEELKKAKDPDSLINTMKERFPSADFLLALERGANANVKH